MHDPLIIGRLGAVYGVQGWLKVISFTDPIDNILNYPQWYIQHRNQWQPIQIESAKMHSNHVVVKFTHIDDREIARTYTNDNIAIENDQLPVLNKDEHYWRDLIGLTVVNLDGVTLGVIDHLLETGANDVIVVKGDQQRLLPYTNDAVKKIDLTTRIMTVDWDPEF